MPKVEKKGYENVSSCLMPDDKKFCEAMARADDVSLSEWVRLQLERIVKIERRRRGRKAA